MIIMISNRKTVGVILLALQNATARAAAAG